MENTPVHQDTPTTNEKTRRKQRKTFSEEDINEMLDAVDRVPKRRHTYNTKQTLDRLRVRIRAAVQAGKSIDDIFEALRPMLGISRQTFDATLQTDETNKDK